MYAHAAAANPAPPAAKSLKGLVPLDIVGLGIGAAQAAAPMSAGTRHMSAIAGGWQDALLLAFALSATTSARVVGVVAAAPQHMQSGGLRLTITSSGSYSLAVDGRPWLHGTKPNYVPGVTLQPSGNPVPREGIDRLGKFESISIDWATPDAPTSHVFRTEFRAYESGTPTTENGGSDEELLTFTQTYLEGIGDTSLYFNSSATARIGTCSAFTDRIPGTGLSTRAGKPLPLAQTTEIALGGFPAFSLYTPEPLNWFAPQGNQLAATSFGRFAPLGFFAENGQNSMPLLLYNESGRAIALTPTEHFFAAVHETVTQKHTVAAGPAASVGSIPAGFSYTTALTAGNGVNATMWRAGSLLLKLSGKKRPDAYKDSFVLSHLGYWTDNGSPYYHRNYSYGISKGLEVCNARLNCTLQDALLAVRDDARERAIPLRYFQFDDHEALDANHWPATPTTPYLNNESYAQVNAGNIVFQSGVTFLGSDPFAIPHPLADGHGDGDGDGDGAPPPFPLSLYIGHGDTRVCQDAFHDGPRCPRVQNQSESGYEWHDGVCVSPAFFDQLMEWGAEAGMAMFEQDFICATQAATAANLTLGRDWFAALDSSARRAGIDVQLCMMGAAEALASTTMFAATNGRGTQDHADRAVSNGLPLGWSSLALISLGLWPSRDNVWTNHSVVAGPSSKWKMQESMPVLQSAMAVLAGGPYGVADVAGAMNRSLVMRACRSDGVLLRPSWPATATDASFRHSFHSLKPLYIWAAHSDLTLTPEHMEGDESTVATLGFLRYSYVLSINTDHTIVLDLAELHQGWTSGWAVSEGWHGLQHGSVQRVQASLTIPPTPELSMFRAGHSLWTVAPLLPGGWAYLGEPEKIVKASHRRIAGVASNQKALRVKLLLARNESVHVAVLLPPTPPSTSIASSFAPGVQLEDPAVVVYATCAAAVEGREGPPAHTVAGKFGDVDVSMALVCLAQSRACTCTHEL